MPPPEVSESIRQKALLALTYRYLADASRLGGKPEEISKVLRELVAKWKKTDNLTNPESNE